MKFVFALFLLNVTLLVQAQTKPHYTASIEAGLTKGSSDKSSVYFFSNGVSYKQLSAGIGVGIDNYSIRSIPLFLDAKKEFGKHKIKPFIGASAGINFPNPTTEQKMIYGGWEQSVDYKHGFFTKASVGVSMSLLHRLRIFINTGYSYKTSSVKFNSYYWLEGMSSNTIDIYHYNRWFVNIGFQL